MNTSTLDPLASLYQVERGSDLPLPSALAALYGRLQLPAHQGRPSVPGNFVSTLDGVVSLNLPGQAGGGPISGESPHDHLSSIGRATEKEGKGGSYAYRDSGSTTRHYHQPGTDLHGDRRARRD